MYFHLAIDVLLSPPSLPFFQACKAALQRLGPLMSSRRVNEMFQKHLKPEDSLLYADFLNDLCKLIVSHLNSLPGELDS